MSDEGADRRIQRIRLELSSRSFEPTDPQDVRFLLECLDSATQEINAKAREINVLKIRNQDLQTLARSLSPRNTATLLDH